MPRDVARVAAATLQVGLGLLAVLLCAFAAVYVADLSSVGDSRALLAGVALLLGLPLFAVWVAARTNLGWLRVLGVAAAVLAIVMAAITVQQVWPARDDAQVGLWTGAWASALAAALWLVILFATVVELRQLPRQGDGTSSGWLYAASIGASLALVVVVALVAGSAGASWMIRFNSDITDTAPAARSRASGLSGAVLWERELTAGTGAVTTRSGLGVPVPSDKAGGAGVVMLDPSTGATVWRYRLRGADDPPEVAPTADGRAVVVSFDEGRLDDDIPHAIFTLDADTGQVQAFWPDPDELQDTDPPVLFTQVGRGTNSVTAISPAGDKLWTYKPERCADPRSVRSTPSVMIVEARQCDEDSDELLGLDTRTGERRWAQPDGGYDEEGAVVVTAAYQLELTTDSLRYRRLDTGAISWTDPTTNTCREPRYLVGAAETVFLGLCDDRTVNEPTSLTSYAVGSGERRWRRQGLQPIQSLTAVDDRGVLALTQGEKTCDLQLLRATRTRTLMSVPGDDQSGSVGVRCSDSRVMRVGDTYLLKLEKAPDLTSDRITDHARYRFIGVA